MKLKAIKKFSMTDEKTLQTISRKIGEEFELDSGEQGELIYSLLHASRITVADKALIPEKGTYICVYAFSYYEPDGRRVSVSPGRNVVLGQETASKFLTSGHIKREHPEQWHPRKLLSGNIVEDRVRRMFDDDLLPPRES